MNASRYLYTPNDSDDSDSLSAFVFQGPVSLSRGSGRRRRRRQPGAAPRKRLGFFLESNADTIADACHWLRLVAPGDS